MKDSSNIVLPIIKGVLLIVLGAICLIKPIEILNALTVYFGLAIGVRGLYLLYKGFKSKRKELKNLTVFNGIMDVLFSLVLIVHPKITLEILPFIFGFWAILSGLLESAIAATQEFKQSWPRFLFGVTILIMGWIILLHPIYAGIMLSDLLGLLFVLIGTGYILITITLRNLI